MTGKVIVLPLDVGAMAAQRREADREWRRLRDRQDDRRRLRRVVVLDGSRSR